MKRIILTTGGTGGHIFPALAVAEEIRARHPEAEILFVGGAWGLEKELAEKAGLPFTGLKVRGLLGRGFKAVAGVFMLINAVFAARGIIKRFKPQVVLGLGGYAGFAPVMAALTPFTGRVPTALLEQNSVPGAANRLLGRWVKKIFLSLPDVKRMFRPERTVVTGNPVRASIRALAAMEPVERGPNDPGRLLILGGSQGAKAVNTAIIEALPRFAEAGLLIRHQTGKLDYDRVRQAYEEQGRDPEEVSAFIEDMAETYGWADLVVCRSGATTVAELAVAAKPSVLVPFPFATHNHQVFNGRVLEENGAALLIEQKDLEHRDLAGTVLELMDDPERLEAMGLAAMRTGHADAAARVVAELEELIRAREVRSKGKQS